MTTQVSQRVQLVDPRDAYVKPPFKEQAPIELPGHSAQMSPAPDHGEESYRGSGTLQGLSALVTGADSGIGRAIAICFAREGANVAINFLSETSDAEQSAEWVRKAGAKSVLLPGDLREESVCEKLIDDTHDEFGSLDILVNNAGYQVTRDDLDGFSTEVFDRIMKTNLYAPFWLCRAAMKRLPAGGCIINTASIQGYDPSAYLLPYSATKSALLGMTKGLAQLGMDHGVRVNAVAPGPVWTPLIPGSMPLEKIEQFGKDTLLQRPAQPIELAPLYVWLASPAASYVTGEIFGCTGGKTPV